MLDCIDGRMCSTVSHVRKQVLQYANTSGAAFAGGMTTAYSMSARITSC